MTTRLTHFLILGYIVLGIFYVFAAGLPQPADFLLVLLIFIALLQGRIVFVDHSRVLFYFVTFTFLVNSVWAAILGEPTLYLASIYFLFNLLVFVLLTQYLNQSTTNQLYAYRAILAALILETIFVLFFDPGGIRAIGTFTNPNQLSYFAIAFTAAALLLADRLEQPGWMQTLPLVLGWIIAVLGLSKAVMVAMAFMTFMLLLQMRNLFYSVMSMVIGALVLVFVFPQQIIFAWWRLSSIGQDNDDNAASRGYDRITNEIEYVILGAGEGAYTRHASVWGGEIHSTFGTLLFCYGIIGLGLFCLFLWGLFRRHPWYFIQFASPLLLYSITHNGLRFTPFWIVLALFTLPVIDRSRSKQRQKPS